MDPVYLDNAATTALDPRVLQVMHPYLCSCFGNANSAHQLGREASVAVEQAREKVAELIGAEPSEIVFTSGGTESDNAAIKGIFDLASRRGKTNVITSPIEHHAVLHSVENLKRQGGVPIYLKPDPQGRITAEQVDAAIDDRTALVSLMHVNNEIGTILPLEEIAEVCRTRGVPFMSDTVQSFGKLPIHAGNSGADLLSMSAHKIHGPKGCGFLYVRKSCPWMPWMHGGSQERRRRGGTLNVRGVVGLAKALELALAEREQTQDRMDLLRDRLLNGLESAMGGRFRLNGCPTEGVPHIVNISLLNPEGKGVDGEMLLLNLDIENFCVSNGSACTSGAMEPSHVLLGIGLEPEIANSSVRISMGRENTLEQMDRIVEALGRVMGRMREAAGDSGSQTA